MFHKLFQELKFNQSLKIIYLPTHGVDMRMYHLFHSFSFIVFFHFHFFNFNLFHANTFISSFK
jgi:hypothetical protein